VKFITNNTVGDNYTYLTFAASGVAPGTYSATSGISLQLEAYDGTKFFCPITPSLLRVKVLDPSTLTNKLSIEVAARPYNPNIAPDLFILSPAFHTWNDSPQPKNNQVMQYTIGTGYEVIQVSFPTTNGTAPTNVVWETRNGLTGTATGSQIFKTNAYENRQGR
jgi:hypothetical protein